MSVEKPFSLKFPTAYREELNVSCVSSIQTIVRHIHFLHGAECMLVCGLTTDRCSESPQPEAPSSRGTSGLQALSHHPEERTKSRVGK